MSNRRSIKYALLAWLQFLIGLAVLGVVDYGIRWRDGWLATTGMPTPDAVWFGVPLLLGLIGVALLWYSTAGIKRLWIRAAIVGVQALLGFCLYMAACLWYVIETGVDSL
jgi:hypothetical protein